MAVNADAELHDRKISRTQTSLDVKTECARLLSQGERRLETSHLLTLVVHAHLVVTMETPHSEPVP